MTGLHFLKSFVRGW